MKSINNRLRFDGRGWEARSLKLANSLNVSDLIQDIHIRMGTVKTTPQETLSNKDYGKKRNLLNDSEKLRTYKTYRNDKNTLNAEWHCSLIYKDHHRILLELRSCSLHIAIETGRYIRPKTSFTKACVNSL